MDIPKLIVIHLLSLLGTLLWRHDWQNLTVLDLRGLFSWLRVETTWYCGCFGSV
jgi:hypothetical protein